MYSLIIITHILNCVKIRAQIKKLPLKNIWLNYNYDI